jgi:AGZA family xanthine/uracil permease-like MFS transporter
MIDARLRRAVAFLLVAAVLTAFGVIHSVHPQGGIYLPWMLEGLPRIVMLQFVGAYVALAVVMGLLSLQRDERTTATGVDAV